MGVSSAGKHKAAAKQLWFILFMPPLGLFILAHIRALR
jgi:hypothetical protein